ncbi:MAG: rod shape-determining protein MreC [Nocardioidaceae bacterium]
MMSPEPRRSRALVGLLALASLTILTLDARHGESGSPIDPLRAVVGSVVGPAQIVATSALRPLTDIPAYFQDLDDVRDRNADLQAANDALTAQLRAAPANSQHTAEITDVETLADSQDLDVVSAEVVALGAAQSFSRTVTIDAGTDDDVRPDLTVLNSHGLVGRVIAATTDSATVLLIVDSESTVGGRFSGSMELGFLGGNGDLSGQGSLDMSLVDHTESLKEGDGVVTWGSRGGAPYVGGVPIGSVISVHSTPSELTQTAQIAPYVDFSSLDVVAVVTGPGDADNADLAAPEQR